MASKTVPPKRPRTKQDVSAKLAEAWFRVAHGRKGAFADNIGASCNKTVDNAINQRSVPELHTVLNSLLDDPTALDEVFALYGGRFIATSSEAANDLQVIAGMNGASSEWLNLILDGIRCERDTQKLAKAFRPLVAYMQAIIEEADAKRSAA